jgi:ankyrin repeat protein
VTKYALAAIVVLALAAPAAASGPPLVDAARAGDVEAVRALLAGGEDAGAPEADGSTPLLWAAYRADLAMARLLIDTGADPNAANDQGATPLWAASENGSAPMAQLLLDAGAAPDAQLLSGETPLMVAARGGFAEVVVLLLDAGADVDHAATRRQTALMWAAAARHPKVVRVLLDHDAAFRLRSERWRQMMATEPHGHQPYNRWIPHGGMTALLFAVSAGDLVSARLLVEAGADVNDADAWGVSATMLAAHTNHGALVEYLLAEGADPNVDTPGFTALHGAVMHRNEAAVRTLVAHGADVHRRVDTWTPTRRSANDYSFLPEMVGATPAWLAARFSTPAILGVLLDNGADPTFVLHGEWLSRSLGSQAQTPESAETTLLMAALGMGGPGRAVGKPWTSTRGSALSSPISTWKHSTSAASPLLGAHEK